MKVQLDCIPCLFRQALNTARVATPDAAVQHRILRRLSEAVADRPLVGSPAAFSQIVYQIVAEETGDRDPYRRIKAETNAAALHLLPGLEQRVKQAADPLDAALHLAAAGNIIDLGIGHDFDLEKDVLRIMQQPFAIHALEQFRGELHPGRRALYLGDNAGEIVFDRVLVQQLIAAGMSVTFVVKSAPVINDATRADAEECGMTALARVIATGSDDIGVHWERASDEFRAEVARADVIVAKGHGNFETCIGCPGNFYFLLKAKCQVVASELGVTLGDIVFRHAPASAPA